MHSLSTPQMHINTRWRLRQALSNIGRHVQLVAIMWHQTLEVNAARSSEASTSNRFNSPMQEHTRPRTGRTHPGIAGFGTRICIDDHSAPSMGSSTTAGSPGKVTCGPAHRLGLRAFIMVCPTTLSQVAFQLSVQRMPYLVRGSRHLIATRS